MEKGATDLSKFAKASINAAKTGWGRQQGKKFDAGTGVNGGDFGLPVDRAGV
jgi:hypothetical protein